MLQRHQQVIAVLQVVVDEVGDDFGIGLRLEGVAQRTQLLALLLMVLDDAVVHQRHAMADMRMRVGLGDTTVGGPAGVADAQHRIEALCLGCGGHFNTRPVRRTRRTSRRSSRSTTAIPEES